jgi:hypothetical protein
LGCAGLENTFYAKMLRLAHPQLKLKQQLLRSKYGNGNSSYRDSDVEYPVPLGISAISAGGLCCCLDMLRELSLDREFVGRVHVVSGKIERHRKLFDFVLDREHPDRYHNDPKDEALDWTDISILAEEKVRCLRVSYRLEDNIGRAVNIAPAKLASDACLARGLINHNYY